MANITNQVNDILQNMVSRLLTNKASKKEVVITDTVTVKCYWCGPVLRCDIQPKENR